MNRENKICAQRKTKNIMEQGPRFPVLLNYFVDYSGKYEAITSEWKKNHLGCVQFIELQEAYFLNAMWDIP